MNLIKDILLALGILKPAPTIEQIVKPMEKIVQQLRDLNDYETRLASEDEQRALDLQYQAKARREAAAQAITLVGHYSTLTGKNSAVPAE